MRVGVALGHGEEVLVVAIGSSCCGDTLEADLEKKVGFGKGKGSHLDCLLHQ